MAKTSCRFLHSTIIKKEEDEDDPKQEKDLLHSTNTASKSKNKNKIIKNRKPVQVQITEVKSENMDDSKVLLTTPKKTFTRPNITAEQIAKLIGYVVTDKMGVSAAARKVGISQGSALSYYHDYQNDPEHRIPAPKRLNKRSSSVTQQKLEDLIRHIVHGGMNLTQAVKKVDIDRRTAAKYYTKYLQDPEQKISLQAVCNDNSSRRYTKEEIVNLIGYIVNDKMSLVEASKKANISQGTARKYYTKYLQNPNHEFPDPCEPNPRYGKHCTNAQVSSLIGYVVNDGMTLVEASVRVDISFNTARKYYKQYLNDPEKCIPTPENNTRCVSKHPPTIDQMKNFFSYVIIEKLNVPQASLRAKISEHTGYKCYNKYLKSSSNQTNIKDMTYSVEKMKRLVELVQNEKMSLAHAAEAVGLNITSARKHYQQYLKNPQYAFPVIKSKQYTQGDIQRLIDYIKRDKMSVFSAARKIKMGYATARRYYILYQNDHERKVPAPFFLGETRKNNTLNKYTKIVADIYKNNPTIKPIRDNHH